MPSLKDMINKFSGSKIKLVLFDLEGVILNGKDEPGTIEKLTAFVNRLYKSNIDFAVITGSADTEFINKLKQKNISVISKSINKVEDAEKLLKELRIDFKNVLFIGDDILDIPLLQKVKISAAPKNARREVKRVVDFQVDNKDLDSMFNQVFKILN